ncbi:MAG TPA: hypothetical protein VJB90_01365 [Candidatus Nanoarchaeia archaeon]|nr:hypothetical protein [Candidatus Nanoarchaeia archaeon]
MPDVYYAAFAKELSNFERCHKIIEDYLTRLRMYVWLNSQKPTPESIAQRGKTLRHLLENYREYEAAAAAIHSYIKNNNHYIVQHYKNLFT